MGHPRRLTVGDQLSLARDSREARRGGSDGEKDTCEERGRTLQVPVQVQRPGAAMISRNRRERRLLPSSTVGEQKEEVVGPLQAISVGATYFNCSQRKPPCAHVSVCGNTRTTGSGIFKAASYLPAIPPL